VKSNFALIGCGCLGLAVVGSLIVAGIATRVVLIAAAVKWLFS
jgi:hypothetical protein